MIRVVGIDPGKKGAFFKLEIPLVGPPIYTAHAMPVIKGKSHKRTVLEAIEGSTKKKRVAVVNDKGKQKIKKDKDLPDWGGIVETFRHFYDDADVYYVERVSGGQSFGKAQSGSFNFGETYGFVCGLVLARGHKLVKVSAAVWKGHYGLGNKDDKSASRVLAARLLPSHLTSCQIDPIRYDREKDDGVAEAGLIGQYGHLQEQLKEL